MSYYGGKTQIAHHYPSPVYDTIIEPFAGSAGYALRHLDRNVILIEKNPIVAGIWKYLINGDPHRIRALPDVPPGKTTDDLDVSEVERHLIGFWLGGGSFSPRKSPSMWMRNRQGRIGDFWGPIVRLSLSRQVEWIRHWKVIEGDYSKAPDIEATWFIDPPYEKQGSRYPCSSKDIDFPSLGKWCLRRKGQVMVCENLGATWLPFTKFREIQRRARVKGDPIKRTTEAIYYRCDKPTGFGL